MSTAKVSPRTPKTHEDVSRGWWVEDIDQEAEQPGASWRVAYVDPFATRSATRGSYGRVPRLRHARHVADLYWHHRVPGKNETEELRQRLDNANNYFRRMAADVFGDEESIKLLVDLYQKTAIKLSEFDASRRGIALSRLTAAHFCEVGYNLIYITEAGQRFIEWLNQK